MKKKIGWLKIAVCAAFFLILGAAFLLAPAAKISAFKTESGDAENSQSCAACHQQNYDSEHYTSHQKTVRPATVENVRGDFSRENHLESADFKAEMMRDGENFFAVIGEQSYKIVAVVGAKYIEQYVAEKDGEFYSLPVGYSLSEKRWVHLNDTDFEKKDANFSRHFQNWQTDCAACHQPGRENFSDDSQNFGISCAACHGNVGEHLASKNSVWSKLGFQTENKIVNPKNLSSDAALLVCANCHSRDLNETAKFTKFRGDGNPLELLSAHGQNDFDSGKFQANGEHKFSGNEFQAIVRSVCYAQSKAGGYGITGEKISCANCHSANDTNGENFSAAKSSNQNCVQCHSQFSDENTIVEHTKHLPNSEASDCTSCHQPETVYGRMRFTRTHEISVPNPALTVEKQIPNACNLCHTDQSVNWAIASSVKLWTERFRDSKTSSDVQFDQPEAVRLLSSKDNFLRALAADAVKKHSVSHQPAPYFLEAFQSEQIPLVRYFLADVIQPK